jgi:hypothetical protein
MHAVAGLATLRLCDTSFEVPGSVAINGSTITPDALHAAVRVNLNFTTQKKNKKKKW